MGTDIYKELFSDPVIKIGKSTLLAGALISFIPTIILAIVYKAIPPIQSILTAWFLCASVYGVEYFMTPISYYPVLGNSGTYMAFLSGNIANVRVPCALVAQDAVGVKPGTEKGEIIATIGMAGSIVPGLIITTITAIVGIKLINIIPANVQKAFDYVLPAIFGALYAMYAMKNHKLALFGIALAITLIYIVPIKLPTILIVPVCSFGTIAFGYYLEKRKATNNQEPINKDSSQ